MKPATLRRMGAKVMVSSTIAGLLLGRLSSWFIATVMRPTLSWAPASAALALYFGLVAITGVIVGNLDWDGASGAFSTAFFVGFVFSPAVVRQVARYVAGLRCEVSLGSLIIGPMTIFLFILFGFLFARFALSHS